MAKLFSSLFLKLEIPKLAPKDMTFRYRLFQYRIERDLISCSTRNIREIRYEKCILTSQRRDNNIRVWRYDGDPHTKFIDIAGQRA